MIAETLASSGKDAFKDFTFSSLEWSAPTMVSPKEIRDRVNSFALCGRTIKGIRMIGLNYLFTRDRVEDAVYGQLDSMPEGERQMQSNYRNIKPQLEFDRCSQIDEPLLIAFEDGDVFELETPQAPEFRMSMNRIPWWIDAGTNAPNVDANILFSPCIGAKIKAIEVNTVRTKEDPMFFKPFCEEPYEREIISRILLRFENGTGLMIGGWFDYCCVDCIDQEGKTLKIDFANLKAALFNWEDLHCDEATGFVAESGTLFFGCKGAEHTASPYMTLSSTGNRGATVNIAACDYLLLDWCTTHATRQEFDEYGEYDFSKDDWTAILDEADKILSFEQFDALFDTLVGWNIQDSAGNNCMLHKLNCSGAAFWENRAKYRTQMKDLCAWSRFVLRDGDRMDIEGF